MMLHQTVVNGAVGQSGPPQRSQSISDLADILDDFMADAGDTDATPALFDDPFDHLDLTAAELFPADIFQLPSGLDGLDGGFPAAATAATATAADSAMSSASSSCDSDSGLGASVSVDVGVNGCSRTRTYDWRRSRDRPPDDCTRLRVEDFAGFPSQHQHQHQQLPAATAIAAFKSEPLDDWLSVAQQQQQQQQYRQYRILFQQPQEQQQQQQQSSRQEIDWSSASTTGCYRVIQPKPELAPSSAVASPSSSNALSPPAASAASPPECDATFDAELRELRRRHQLLLAEGDQAKVKRIERMIKNRHSASESRRKRKEYLDGLERRVQSLASENSFLREENSHLRQRYSELERKLISLEHALGGGGGAVSGVGRRRPVTVMALLLFLGLNLVGLGVWSPLRPHQPEIQETRALVPYGARSSTGRHLLSAAPEPAPEELSALFGRLCPVHNSTESTRLARELDGWAFRYQREAGVRELRRLNRMRVRREERLKHRQAAAEAAAQSSAAAAAAAGALQLWPGRDSGLDLLMRALDRRNDTMYLVSFRSDHLVFPALAINKTGAATARPRMTFLMPAVNESGRAASGTVPLMQIDCEVVSLGMMHLEKWRVPLQFRHDLFANNRP